MFASIVKDFWSAFEINVADVINIQHFQNQKNIGRVKVKALPYKSDIQNDAF